MRERLKFKRNLIHLRAIGEDLLDDLGLRRGPEHGHLDDDVVDLWVGQLGLAVEAEGRAHQDLVLGILK